MIIACKLPTGLMLGAVPVNGSRSPQARIEGGYGLTQVDAAVWSRWFEANAQSDLVRNGLIHGAETEPEMLAWIAAHRCVRSGFEGAGPGC